MKIKYEFNNGDITEVEVSEEIGEMIIDSRRKEEAGDRMKRRYCYSMDAAVYEGSDYGIPDFTEELFDESEERNAHIYEAFSHLSEVQQHRILLLAGGMSIREIARREGKDFSSVRESIEAARKNFLKFF